MDYINEIEYVTQIIFLGDDRNKIFWTYSKDSYDSALKWGKDHGYKKAVIFTYFISGKKEIILN